MAKGKFICIIGIDGSGKTTQAKKLVANLTDKGYNCKYKYGRIIPILPRPFMYIGKKIFLKNGDMYSDFNDYSVKKKKLFKNNLLSKIYQNFILFDYLLQVFFKIQLPLQLGITIVSDRYVYDTIVTDLSIDLSYTDEKINNMLKSLFKIIPKPNITYFIDVPEEIAFSRKNDVPSIIYLKDRRANYLKVARLYKMEIIDGSKDILSIEKQILDTTLMLYMVRGK